MLPLVLSETADLLSHVKVALDGTRSDGKLRRAI